MAFQACLFICSLFLFNVFITEVGAQAGVCITSPASYYNVQTQRCAYSTVTGDWTVSDAATYNGRGWDPKGACGLTALLDPPTSSIDLFDKRTLDCCTDEEISALTYAPATQYCCNERMSGARIPGASAFVDTKNSTFNQCCGNQRYLNSTSHCCDGNLYAKSAYPLSSGWSCCGASMMNSTQFCCNNVIYNKITSLCSSRSTLTLDSCAWGEKLYDKCCAFNGLVSNGVLPYNRQPWGHGEVPVDPIAPEQYAYCPS